MSQTAPWRVRILFRLLALPRGTVFCVIFAIPLTVAALQSIVARRLDPSLFPALLLFSIAYAAQQRNRRRAA